MECPCSFVEFAGLAYYETLTAHEDKIVLLDTACGDSRTYFGSDIMKPWYDQYLCLLLIIVVYNVLYSLYSLSSFFSFYTNFALSKKF